MDDELKKGETSDEVSIMGEENPTDDDIISGGENLTDAPLEEIEDISDDIDEDGDLALGIEDEIDDENDDLDDDDDEVEMDSYDDKEDM